MSKAQKAGLPYRAPPRPDWLIFSCRQPGPSGPRRADKRLLWQGDLTTLLRSIVTCVAVARGRRVCFDPCILGLVKPTMRCGRGEHERSQSPRRRCVESYSLSRVQTPRGPSRLHVVWSPEAEWFSPCDHEQPHTSGQAKATQAPLTAPLHPGTMPSLPAQPVCAHQPDCQSNTCLFRSSELLVILIRALLPR